MNPFSYAEYFLSITCLRVKNSGAKKGSSSDGVIPGHVNCWGTHTSSKEIPQQMCASKFVSP